MPECIYSCLNSFLVGKVKVADIKHEGNVRKPTQLGAATYIT